MSFPKRNITGVINVEIECALYLCIMWFINAHCVFANWFSVHDFINLCTYLQLLLSKCKIQIRTVVLGSLWSGHKASKKFLDPVPHETAAGNQKGNILESAYSELRCSQILLTLKKGKHLPSAHSSVMDVCSCLWSRQGWYETENSDGWRVAAQI